MLGTMPWAELHAQGQPVSTTFKVQARVEAGCEVTASDPNRHAITLLRATCAPDTTYDIGLNKGALRSAFSGKTNSTDTVTRVGTGGVVDHTLFGGFPATRVVPAGEYADTVTVHIYY